MDVPISYSGYCAFTHKAGIHAKAILNNPSTYEILKPEDFGLTRYVSIGFVIHHELRSCTFTEFFFSLRHRLTGWNAVKSRVEQLGLSLNDDEVRLAVQSVHLSTF
jgi:homocitrate synthase